MATVQSIAKAKGTGLILKNLLGVEPQYDYQVDHVKLYYTGNSLNQVRERINQIAVSSQRPGDVRIDFVPMVAPLVIKKVFPFAIGAIITGYLLGKIE